MLQLSGNGWSYQLVYLLLEEHKYSDILSKYYYLQIWEREIVTQHFTNNQDHPSKLSVNHHCQVMLPRRCVAVVHWVKHGIHHVRHVLRQGLVSFNGKVVPSHIWLNPLEWKHCLIRGVISVLGGSILLSLKSGLIRGAVFGGRGLIRGDYCICYFIIDQLSRFYALSTCHSISQLYYWTFKQYLIT